MNNETEALNWIALSEYSNEYGISVSTLRRRIKGEQIDYKKINGKYYLPNKLMRPKAPTPVPVKDVFEESRIPGEFTERVSSYRRPPDEPIPDTTQALLKELKKAYMNSLQDKEKNIIQLKQQVADLQTLVLYLEKENKRLASTPDLTS